MKVNISCGNSPSSAKIETEDGQALSVRSVDVYLRPRSQPIAHLVLADVEAEFIAIEGIISLKQLEQAAKRYGMKLVEDTENGRKENLVHSKA